MSLQNLSEKVTYDPSMFVNVDGVKVQKKCLANKKMIKNLCDIQPTSSLNSSCFQTQNNVQIIFDLSRMDCHIPKEGYLRMVLTNNDGSNALDLVPTQFLFQFLQIEIGNVITDTIYANQQYSDFCQFTPFVNFTEKANACYINPSNFNSALTIPASSSVTVYMPIYIPIFLQNIPVTLMDNLVTRLLFTCNGGNILATSTGSGHASISSLSLTQCSLRVIGENFMREEDKNYLKAELRNGPLEWRVLCHEYNPLLTNTLATGSVTNLQPNINCRKAVALQVYPLTPSGSGNTLYQPLSLVQWNFVDSGSMTKTGMPISLNIDNTMSKYLINAYQDTLFFNTVNLYQFSWSTDLPRSFLEGQDLGNIRIDSSDRLLVQPGSNAAYQMALTALCLGLIRIDNGRVTIEK